MKKGLKILSSIFAPLTLASVIGTTIISTSCSNSPEANNPNIQSNPSIQSYDVILRNGQSKVSNKVEGQESFRPSILTNISSELPNNSNTNEGEIDPNFNVNPINQIQKILKELDDSIKKTIETDLNSTILDFYSCMEKESQSQEIELVSREDAKASGRNVIEVKNVDISKIISERKIIVTANILLELDTNTKKTNEKNITFDLYTEFAGKQELMKIFNKIKANKDQNPSVDYSDLLEIFLGENDQDFNDEFDFDDNWDENNSSISEIGLFNYMSNFNDNVNPNAKMFGYTFNVEDFWSKISGINYKSASNNNLTFWSPSTSINKIFLPNLNNNQNNNILGSDFNFKLDINSVKQTYSSYDNAWNKLNTLKNNSSNIKTELEKLGIKFPKNMSISSVVLGEKDNDEFELKINDQFGNEFEFEFYKVWWIAK